MNVSLYTLINPAMTRMEARQALFKAGWEFVGGGSFASVWRSPDGERVIKVTKPDRGAEAIYNVATANPGNPHLPRYFARLELDRGGYVYEAEALEECNRCIPAHEDIWRVCSRLEGEPTSGDAAHPELGAAFAAIEAYAEEQEELIWDLFPGNVMFRGETVVINDPLFDTKCMTQNGTGGSKHNAAAVAKSCEDDPVAQLMQPQFDEVAA